MNGFASIPGLLKLFVFTAKLDVSRSMAYRFDFIMGTLISFLFACAAPFVQYMIFKTTNGYPGWSIPQLIMFQGVLLFWGGFRQMMFGRVFGETMALVRTGDFDRLLVKPYPPIGVLLSNGFTMNGVAPTIGGLAFLIAAAANAEVVLEWWTIPLFVAMLFFGLLMLIAFYILLCTILIMVVQMPRVGELFERIGSFSEYPLALFPRGLKMFFSFAFPIALWINFPAQVLLGRLEPVMIWGVLFSIVMVFVSNAIWKVFLHKYTSAGG